MTEHQKNLVDILGKIRRGRLCCYHQKDESSVCDCKYGAGDMDPVRGGEQTGCPEMRDAIKILEFLTPREFARIQIRVAKRQATLSRRARVAYQKRQRDKSKGKDVHHGKESHTHRKTR